MNDQSHADEKLLNEYMDGMLSMSLITNLEAHLAGCLECQARLAEIRIVFKALGALPEIPLEDDLVNEVLEMIDSLPLEESRLSLSSRAGKSRRNGNIFNQMEWSALFRMKSLGWFSLVQMLLTLILLIVSWPAIFRKIPTQFFAFLLEQIELTRQGFLTAWRLHWNSLWSSLQATLEIVFERWYGHLNQLELPQIPLQSLIVFTVVVVTLWIIVNGLIFTKHNSNGNASILRRRI